MEGPVPGAPFVELKMMGTTGAIRSNPDFGWNLPGESKYIKVQKTATLQAVEPGAWFKDRCGEAPEPPFSTKMRPFNIKIRPCRIKMPKCNPSTSTCCLHHQKTALQHSTAAL